MTGPPRNLSAPKQLNGKSPPREAAPANFDPNTGNVVPDANDFVFWDGFHPTTNAHFIAAEFIYRSIISSILLLEDRDTQMAKIDSWLPVRPY